MLSEEGGDDRCVWTALSVQGRAWARRLEGTSDVDLGLHRLQAGERALVVRTRATVAERASLLAWSAFSNSWRRAVPRKT